MFEEAFKQVFDAWVASAKETQSKQQDFDAATEMYDRALGSLNSAKNSEAVAWDALLSFRADVMDGGWHEATPPEMPAEQPDPMPEAPVENSEAPASEPVPAPEVAPMSPESAPAVSDASAPEVGADAPEVMPEAVPAEEAPATPGGLTLPSMTDDSLVAKLPTAEFGPDEF